MKHVCTRNAQGSEPDGEKGMKRRASGRGRSAGAPSKTAHAPATPTKPHFAPEPDADDTALFRSLVDTEITAEQAAQLTTPAHTYPDQRHVLAIHWHPQHVSLETARQRITRLFPDSSDMLIIPTEHNALHEWDEFAGVEADCRDLRLDLKVQLLLHFKAERVREAHTLRSMLAHTARYRGLQLRDLLETAAAPAATRHRHRTERAVRATGADHTVVALAAACARKLLALLGDEVDAPSTDERRSTLLRDFVEARRPLFGPMLTPQLHAYTKALRDRVKAEFPLRFFHDAHAFIEEARGLGGVVTIPHPEQFWPILLAGYDVDAIEVWNPQSRRHTNFLISVIRENNENRFRNRPVLITMGDDTHLGELLRQAEGPDKARLSREIGVQPLWTDATTLMELQAAGMVRDHVMAAYRERLNA